MAEPGVRPGDGFSLLALAVFGALGLVVMTVGAVALVAEYVHTWDYFFLMERTVAAATPVVSGLLVAAVLVGLAAIVRS